LTVGGVIPIAAIDRLADLLHVAFRFEKRSRARFAGEGSPLLRRRRWSSRASGPDSRPCWQFACSFSKRARFVVPVIQSRS